MNICFIDIDIFNSDWIIYKIIGDKLILKNLSNNEYNVKKKIKKNKKVTFKKKIEICNITKNKEIKEKFKDDMIKYGNEACPKKVLFESYVYNISRYGNINLNLVKFMCSLRILNLYYYIMSRFLECYSILLSKEKYFLYTKRTYVSSNQLILIKNFIETKTDILKKLTIIKKFYNRYCRVL